MISEGDSAAQRVMDIEEYARKHRHFWGSAKLPPELKFILDNNLFKTIVDIGCGDGGLLYLLKGMRYLEGPEVWAIDSSETRLNSVRQISSRIVTVKDDAQSLEKVPDSYFDLIISTQVIEHVYSDEQMIESIARIAKPGAVVYLDTIFKKAYGQYFYRNRHGQLVLDPTHEREYSSEGRLYDAMRSAGFKIVHSKKDPVRLSILNFFLRRTGTLATRNSSALSALSKIKLPVPGYLCWKIVLVRG